MSAGRKWKGRGRFYSVAWRALCDRAGVATRDELVCHWCGGGADDVGALVLDHEPPVAAGGEEFDVEGLVASCSPCNLRRGAWPGPPRRVEALAHGGTSRRW